MINHEIASRLKHALKTQNVTKYAPLAMALNVDESTICRWQKDGNLSLNNARSLCAYLDISMDWLLLGRGNAQQHRQFSASELEKTTIFNFRKIDEDCIKHINLFLTAMLKA